jgi:Tol biopolymer transport system component
MKRTAALLAVLALTLTSCKDKLPTQGDGKDGTGTINRIFYSTGFGGAEESEIYSVDPKTGSDVKLIAKGELGSAPQAGKIAYGVRGTPGHFMVFVADIDGRNPVQIKLDSTYDWATSLPILSHDGKTIACMSGIYLVLASSDGSKVTKTEQLGAEYGDPAISPTGKWMAYADFHEPFLWVTSTTQPGDFGNQRFSPDNNMDTHTRPVVMSWSPASDKIAYSGYKPAWHDRDIFVTVADFQGSVDITNDSTSDEIMPSWSPNGKKIAFVRDSMELDVINTDGTGLVRLTHVPNPNEALVYPMWSPDSRKIIYIGQSATTHSLHVIDVESGVVGTITDRASRAFWAP